MGFDSVQLLKSGTNTTIPKFMWLANLFVLFATFSNVGSNTLDASIHGHGGDLIEGVEINPEPEIYFLRLIDASDSTDNYLQKTIDQSFPQSIERILSLVGVSAPPHFSKKKL
ncbi:MAG: hypothetical protein F4100_02700 [Rhodothermaceae bacterium]|nr:hypothetical protein [Rhodothermaceae bacterium]MYJ19644.1 hypothetical protein [Rhodothermaceae bacterium]